jgi:hypothetical protein
MFYFMHPYLPLPQKREFFYFIFNFAAGQTSSVLWDRLRPNVFIGWESIFTKKFCQTAFGCFIKTDAV